jgi:hypothetical protein
MHPNPEGCQPLAGGRAAHRRLAGSPSDAPRRGASAAALPLALAPLPGCNTSASCEPEVALRLPPANRWQASGLAIQYPMFKGLRKSAEAR